VRAVVRLMSTLGQPSSITRDVWRMGRITAAEQERIRRLTESSPILHAEINTQILADRFGPDIRYLFSFMQIARVGNFGYAARELNVDQSTLSLQIQALEKTYAAKLLVRHGRGATLTRAGLRLARRLERLPADVGDKEAEGGTHDVQTEVDRLHGGDAVQEMGV